MNGQSRPGISLRRSSLKTATGRRRKVAPRATQPVPATILVLATPSAALDGLLTALEFRGYRVLFTARAEEAFRHLARQALDLLMVELGAGGPERLAVIQAAQNSLPAPPVILLGSLGTPLPPVAFQLEVADYLLLPEAGGAALRRVDRALGRPRLRDRTDAEARLAALNLKTLLQIKEMVAACTDLLQALGGALDTSATGCRPPQAFTRHDSGLDLEVPA